MATAANDAAHPGLGVATCRTAEFEVTATLRLELPFSSAGGGRGSPESLSFQGTPSMRSPCSSKKTRSMRCFPRLSLSFAALDSLVKAPEMRVSLTVPSVSVPYTWHNVLSRFRVVK